MNLTDKAFEETAQKLEKDLSARLESVKTFLSRFTKEIKAMFEGVPSIAQIRWTQYTPYFNDGDSCEFSINDLIFIRDSVLAELERIGESELYYEDLYAWSAKHHLPSAQAKLIENLADFMEDNEDSLKACFGDHSEIVINRDGTISVEVYDHD